MGASGDNDKIVVTLRELKECLSDVWEDSRQWGDHVETEDLAPHKEGCIEWHLKKITSPQSIKISRMSSEGWDYCKARLIEIASNCPSPLDRDGEMVRGCVAEFDKVLAENEKLREGLIQAKDLLAHLSELEDGETWMRQDEAKEILITIREVFAEIETEGQ